MNYLTDGYLSKSKIEEVRSVVEIVEVVSQKTRLVQKGTSFWGLCPFHGDTNPSLKVDPDRSIWYCFGCGEGGNVFNFIMKSENISFVEAVKNLAVRHNIELFDSAISKEQHDEIAIQKKVLVALKISKIFFIEQLNRVKRDFIKKYLLEERGISEKLIKRFGLGYAPKGWNVLDNFLIKNQISQDIAIKAGLLIKGKRVYDRFRNRIMFPIFDINNKLISFSGRVVENEEPKYLNGPNSIFFSKSRVLYNLNLAKEYIKKKQRVLVVEGYFDVMVCVMNGFCETVGLMGTAFTLEQIRSLKGQSCEVVLIFDGDQAGLKAAKRSLPFFISENIFVRVFLLPRGEDPDTFLRKYGSEKFELGIRKSVPLVKMVIDNIIEQGYSSPEEKGKILKKITVFLKKIKDHVIVWDYVEYLAKKMGLPLWIISDYLNLDFFSRNSFVLTKEKTLFNFGDISFNDERCLLELALSSPKVAEVLYEHGLFKELKDPSIQHIATTIVSLLSQKIKPLPSIVIDFLDDKSLSSLVSQLTEKGPRFVFEDSKKELEIFIQTWKKKRAKIELKVLDQKIDDLYRSGNLKEVASLQRCRREIQDSYFLLKNKDKRFCE